MKTTRLKLSRVRIEELVVKMGHQIVRGKNKGSLIGFVE